MWRKKKNLKFYADLHLLFLQVYSVVKLVYSRALCFNHKEFKTCMLILGPSFCYI